jgi:hypothetical protein
MSDIDESVAIWYFEERGIILPGHADTIAEYRRVDESESR